MSASDISWKSLDMRREDEVLQDLIDRTMRTTAVMAGRLADEQLLADAVRQAKATSKYPFQWGGPGLYGGHAGMAMMFGHAASVLSDETGRWRAVARRFIKEAARHTRDHPVPLPGLGIGTSGLTLAIEQLAAGDPALLPTLRPLREQLARQVLQAPSWRADDGVSPEAYDVISGAAGVLSYLASLPEPNTMEREACGVLIDDLSWMCDPMGGTKRWHVPPHRRSRLMPPEQAEEYAHGYIDLGLAHGLAGPLSALSLAWNRGYRRPGLRSAIEHVAAFLLDMSDHDEYGPCWPRMVALSPSGVIQRKPPEAGQMSWCYGPPGICSALLDAADTLADQSLRSTAIEGFDAALKRVFAGHGHLVSASLCHGRSGLLVICRKFAREDPDGAARAALPDLVEYVLDACDPAHPLIVKEFQAPDGYIDSPAFLDGSAGIPLALWSMSDAADAGWQRAILIR